MLKLCHRHLREIDCSSAIVGGPAAGAESGANQYTGPACGAKKCFIVAAAAGDITTTINKGRRAGPMSSLLLLDVYELCTDFCQRENMSTKEQNKRLVIGSTGNW